MLSNEANDEVGEEENCALFLDKYGIVRGGWFLMVQTNVRE